MISDFLETAITAARRAGKLILESVGSISKDDVGLKQTHDYVTHVDRESEKIIVETIRDNYPQHRFLAEESLQESGADVFRWIVDPLDGTTNYIHGYPVFSVSIALEQQRETLLGVILDPVRDELFCAEKGRGAFLNYHPVQISQSADIQSSLITTGFPFRKKDMTDCYLRLFRNIFMKVSDLRRAGSAALDLAYLASGRCDGFFEIGLSPWDIAAGELMVKEAGGVITDFGGGSEYLKTGNVVAGVPEIHGFLLNEIQSVFRGVIDK